MYEHYFTKGAFDKITIEGNFDFRITPGSIYSVKTAFKKLLGNVPFHHEPSVSSNEFKGLKIYHTHQIYSLSNEFRISIYKAYIYIGAFIDATFFRGSGYDLSGNQQGIAGGPTVRLLLLDHFEFYFYYGQDFLFSRKKTESNFFFGLFKKW